MWIAGFGKCGVVVCRVVCAFDVCVHCAPGGFSAVSAQEGFPVC